MGFLTENLVYPVEKGGAFRLIKASYRWLKRYREFVATVSATASDTVNSRFLPRFDAIMADVNVVELAFFNEAVDLLEQAAAEHHQVGIFQFLDGRFPRHDHHPIPNSHLLFLHFLLQERNLGIVGQTGQREIEPRLRVRRRVEGPKSVLTQRQLLRRKILFLFGLRRDFLLGGPATSDKQPQEDRRAES